MQLNKGLVGFLTHSGYAHGGNGFEGIAFLIERFKDTGLRDPGEPTTASTCGRWRRDTRAICAQKADPRDAAARRSTRSQA